MRISTSKSETMVLSRKRVACPLQVGDEILPQVEEFKYLAVLFTSEGRMEREMDRRIGAASAVMQTLYRSDILKLSIYRSIYVPTLTYGHELWVVTEKTRSRIQGAEMSFFRRVSGLSLRDRVRSSVIREDIRVESLLLHIERSQMRWLGHLIRMPPGHVPPGGDPGDDPGHAGETTSFGWPGNALGSPPEELDEVAGEREVWTSLLKLLPPRPYPDKRHGTRCAGEVAAVANNGICGVGVAYNAKIGGVRMLDGEVTDMVEAQSLSLNPQHIDIYSASWGPEDDGKTVDGPAKLAKEAFLRGVTEGRGGLGSIFVWASGNGGRDKDSCNCDGYTNSIYTLSISSSTQNGFVPWYSEACSSTLATTYSSGNLNEKQIITTDLKAKCTDSHTGTSASAPLAAGIIALALEANKNLTWRDMQHLVVQTSHPAHLATNDWNTNGVGRKVSHSYGYGLLDASGIVALAKTWTSVGPQRKCVITLVYEPKNIGGHLSVNKSVDACLGSDSHVTSLEHVQARLTLSYNRRGNLAIHLISPAGTRSTLLHPRPHDYSSEGFNDWAFMTTHSWDENPSGKWTLEIENVAGASDYGTLTQFILVLYGTGPRDDSQPVNGNCKTLDLKQTCLECNAGYYLFMQSCVTQCPTGYAVGSQPLNYTVGNYISPASVPACMPCLPPCLTCSSLSVEACLSCPPHRSLNTITGTCDRVTQYMRESPGVFVPGQGDAGLQPQLSSQLPMTVAILSCMAIMAVFAGIFLLLQLRSGALVKLPSLEAGGGSLTGGFSLGGNRVVSYRGIPTVWGDDGANTDSENEEFDVQNERTAFIKTQSAL
ncbi:furin (paired basic amino acid cleaving enzyme) a isoform X2 [Phyllopteryx taeniolatus]|uniref:furin (paired basic amino acid cleaving enzyme) a isoform X2 n=1 Tax=Phyllopteryx taeniolatus TaxID=161469 RepID=UPI002AD5003C|nr:furin (paired basic amino acid cleaving enzyme) a isoform X2 [Phyllopteryx taeniolatus]